MFTIQRVLFAAALTFCLAMAPAVASAATFTVNDMGDGSDFDAGDGTCEVTDGGGDCTLRAAIEEANQLDGADIINFSVTGTITLGSALEAVIEDLQILGPGQNALTVDLDGNVGPVFIIDSRRKPIIDGMQTTVEHQVDGLEQTLEITGLTIMGSGGHDGTDHDANEVPGADADRGKSGGVVVVNNDTLILTNSRVTGNESDQDEDNTAAGINIGGNAEIRNVMVDNNEYTGDDSGNNEERAIGAGIVIGGGEGRTVLLENVTVRENTTVAGGGGIAIAGGDKVVSLRNVTVEDNTAMEEWDSGGNGEGGGGIVVSGGAYTLILENVIVDGNLTNGVGGGIMVTGGGAKTILAKGIQVSNNISEDNGGGIWVRKGNIKIYNSTISGNEAGPMETTVTNESYDTHMETVAGQVTYQSGPEAAVVRGAVPGTVEIAVSGEETFTDTMMDGTLQGSGTGTGTIDYATGEWSITLDSDPGSGDDIDITVDRVLGSGGGIALNRYEAEGHFGDVVQLIGTSVTGNTAAVDGGGIFLADGKLFSRGGSISGNTAGNLGGGISVNRAGSDDNDGSGLVGAFFGEGLSIAGNTADGGAHEDCSGTVFNLGGLGIGVTDGCNSVTSENLLNMGVDFRGATGAGAGGSDGCVLSPGTSRGGYGFVFLMGLAIAFAAAWRRRSFAPVKSVARKGGMLLLLLAVLAIPSSALAATFTVSDTGDGGDEDTGDDTCEVTDSMGDCTLRAAIEQANATEGADMIDFSVTGEIDLGSALPTITESVTITGPGSASLTLDLQDNDGPHFGIGSGNDGDFGPSQADVRITGLTLSGSGDNGAIDKNADSSGTGADNLTLEDLIVENNEDDSSSLTDAGGINIGGGHLTMRNVIIRNNTGGDAGGMEIGLRPQSWASLTDVEIRDNISMDGGGGLRIRGAGSSIALKNVIIDGNEAQDGSGGGIMITGAPKNLTIVDSEITNNSATLDGGGLYTNTGVIQVNNVLVSDNSTGSIESASNIDMGDTVMGTAAYEFRLPSQEVEETSDGADVINDYGNGEANWRRLDPGSISIDVGGDETFTDPGEDGVLVGGNGGSGTVDYLSGEVSLTLNSGASGVNVISADYDVILGDGGGIYATDLTEDNAYGGTVLEFNRLAVTDNTAMNAGGGISTPTGTVLGTGIALSGNSAGGKGGGVYAPQDELSVGYQCCSGDRYHPAVSRLVFNGAALSGNTAASGPACYGKLQSVGGISLDSASECINEAVANYFGFGGVVSGDDCTLNPTKSGSSMFILMSAVAAIFMISRRRRSNAR